MQEAEQQQQLAALVERGSREGWLVNKSEVTCGVVLGRGAFGTTYLGTWRGGSVAVKVVRVSQAAELANFVREVQSMSLLKHPHIVTFLGAVICAPLDFWLLTEYMPGGTLASWLHPKSSSAQQAAAAAAHRSALSQHPPPGFAREREGSGPHGAGSKSWESDSGRKRAAAAHLRPYLERLTMALEVASGLLALESCSPPIIHRDVKPSNVLIDGGGHARVADFGLSRQFLAREVAEFTGETGTYLYMAPEMMRHEVYDTKVDVWSWGVLFVQAITCQVPYADEHLTAEQVALGVAEHTLQPRLPANVNRSLQMLAGMACSCESEDRPGFELITATLKSTIDHIRSQGVASEPMGMLSRLHHTLTASWGDALSRLYPAPPAPAPPSRAMPPRAKLRPRGSGGGGGASAASGGTSPMAGQACPIMRLGRDAPVGVGKDAPTTGGESPPTSHGSSSGGGGGGGGSGGSSPMQVKVLGGRAQTGSTAAGGGGGGGGSLGGIGCGGVRGVWDVRG
ncbi:MAG: hypothetical protein WDW36_004490 [Sanguina aurantia]